MKLYNYDLIRQLILKASNGTRLIPKFLKGNNPYYTWYDNGMKALIKKGIKQPIASYIMKHAAGEGGYTLYFLGDGKNKFSLMQANLFADHVVNWLFTAYPKTKVATNWQQYIKALYTREKAYNTEYGKKFGLDAQRTNGLLPQDALDDWSNGYLHHFDGYKTLDKIAETWKTNNTETLYNLLDNRPTFNFPIKFQTEPKFNSIPKRMPQNTTYILNTTPLLASYLPEEIQQENPLLKFNVNNRFVNFVV